MITKKRIRNSTHHLSAYLKKGEVFQLGVQITGTSDIILQKIGFVGSASVGDSILPLDKFGRFSWENCHGKFGPAKRDLPKIPFDVSFTSTIKDWHGSDHLVTISQTREKYQRDFFPPNGIELSVHNDILGNHFIITKQFTFGQDEDLITHAINLILEIFKKCDIFDSKGGRIINSPITRVNWKMLPQGSMPWTKLHTHLLGTLTALKPQHRAIVEGRLQYINTFSPVEVAVGLGGFSDYLAFSIASKNVWLLECIKCGNASYLMSNDWKEISQLTKSDIINGQLSLSRIIHNDGWQNTINKLLK